MLCLYATQIACSLNCWHGQPEPVVCVHSHCQTTQQPRPVTVWAAHQPCTHTCAHTHIHIQTHTHIHTHTHTHTYTHTCDPHQLCTASPALQQPHRALHETTCSLNPQQRVCRPWQRRGTCVTLSPTRNDILLTSIYPWLREGMCSTVCATSPSTYEHLHNLLAR